MARIAATASKTDFINVALSKLGSDRVQMSDYDSDNTEIKELVDIYYDSTLEETINVTDWNCCKFVEKVEGAEVTDSDSGDLPKGRTGSEFPYNRKVRIITDPTTSPIKAKKTQFEVQRVINVQPQWQNSYAIYNAQTAIPKISWEQIGAFLFFRSNSDAFSVSADNYANLILTYIFNPLQAAETNGSFNKGDSPFYFFDSLFLKCWYTRLAMKLCVPLTGSQDLAGAIQDELNNICIPEAIRINAVEGHQIRPHGADYKEVGSINSYKNFQKV